MLEAALEFGGVSARTEFAGDGGSGEHLGFGDQIIHRDNALIQIVLELIEIPMIRVRDRFWDVPLGNPIYIFCRDIQRTDHRVQSLVDALHDPGEIPLELCGLTARIKLPLLGCIDQPVQFLDHRANVDAHRLERFGDNIHLRTFRNLYGHIALRDGLRRPG